MPIVRIQIAKGRSKERKQRVMKAVTDAIEASLEVPRSTIHVMMQEIPNENIMIGGEPLSDDHTQSEK